MTTKKINGSRYFDIRILMIDRESYDKVTSYLMETAIKVEANEGEVMKGRTNYILDKDEKEIARTNFGKRIIELTKEVKPEIRSKIEKIIAGYY